MAEFEREVIQERTNAGLQAARARGKLGGQPKAITDPKKLALLLSLYDSKQHSIDDICDTLHISRGTLYRYVRPSVLKCSECATSARVPLASQHPL
ncbi:MAG TPA: helix-turn-helix domain-containing protein [Ktedonobacteraceae bacterium]